MPGATSRLGRRAGMRRVIPTSRPKPKPGHVRGFDASRPRTRRRRGGYLHDTAGGLLTNRAARRPVFLLEIKFLPSIVALGHVPGKRPLSRGGRVPVQFAPDKWRGYSEFLRVGWLAGMGRARVLAGTDSPSGGKTVRPARGNARGADPRPKASVPTGQVRLGGASPTRALRKCSHDGRPVPPHGFG